MAGGSKGHEYVKASSRLGTTHLLFRRSPGCRPRPCCTWKGTFSEPPGKTNVAKKGLMLCIFFSEKLQVYTEVSGVTSSSLIGDCLGWSPSQQRSDTPEHQSWPWGPAETKNRNLDILYYISILSAVCKERDSFHILAPQLFMLTRVVVDQLPDDGG